MRRETAGIKADNLNTQESKKILSKIHLPVPRVFDRTVMKNIMEKTRQKFKIIGQEEPKIFRQAQLSYVLLYYIHITKTTIFPKWQNH